jgi:hypothetical protein
MVFALTDLEIESLYLVLPRVGDRIVRKAARSLLEKRAFCN